MFVLANIELKRYFACSILSKIKQIFGEINISKGKQ